MPHKFPLICYCVVLQCIKIFTIIRLILANDGRYVVSVTGGLELKSRTLVPAGEMVWPSMP